MEQFLTMLVIDYGGMQSDTRLVPVGRLDFVELGFDSCNFLRNPSVQLVDHR